LRLPQDGAHHLQHFSRTIDLLGGDATLSI
jgi:hypothetical protein